MNESLQAKYFIAKEDDTFKANDSLLAKIDYKVGNILTDNMPQNMDLIFCRNTVIYFNKEAKDILYEGFFNTLEQNGYFIMGKTETLSGPAVKLFKTEDAKERIFKKA